MNAKTMTATTANARNRCDRTGISLLRGKRAGNYTRRAGRPEPATSVVVKRRSSGILGFFQASADGLHQRFNADGLVQDAGEIAGVDIRVYVARDEDDGPVAHPVLRRKAPLDRAAIEARQHQIEDYGIDGLPFETMERVNAIFRGDYAITLERQYTLVQLTKRLIVLDN